MLAAALLTLAASAPAVVLPAGPLAPVVLDVRTLDEWNAGHVSCAHRLPVQDDPSLMAQVKALVSNDLTAPIVTYCHSGVRAGQAETALKAAGFTYVRNGGGYAIPPANTAALQKLCAPTGPIPSVTVQPGLDVPMIVMGTGSGQKGDVEDAATKWWSQAGGTGIDTAYGYHDEDGIAAGLVDVKPPRNKIFIETKIPCSDYATATAALSSNLVQLGLHTVDLTLIHFPCSGHNAATGNSETWRAMEDFQKAGKSTAIGVSNFAISDLEALASTVGPSGPRVVPALNQCKFSVVHHDDPTIAYCVQHGITYQSYSPLCGGFNGSSCSRGGGTYTAAMATPITT